MVKINLRSRHAKRKLRVRKKVYGIAVKPRLSVFRSNKYIYAQLIDDASGNTLVAAKGAKDVKSAFEVGKEVATKAQAKKIAEVVFDRNGYRYHGKVKSLADGAREGGLKF